MASGVPSVHQRKLGPAPIASFEDLSDEVENGEPATRMPGIVEVTTPATPGSSLKTPSTPRIDISRASSSSHHEDSNSRESSPERELLAGILRTSEKQYTTRPYEPRPLVSFQPYEIIDSLATKREY